MRNRGLKYTQKKFSVPMRSGDKTYNRCDHCKAKKCDKCEDGSEFVDRGFVVIKR